VEHSPLLVAISFLLPAFASPTLSAGAVAPCLPAYGSPAAKASGDGPQAGCSLLLASCFLLIAYCFLITHYTKLPPAKVFSRANYPDLFMHSGDFSREGGNIRFSVCIFLYRKEE
jgi:hypothetical protein